MARPAHSPHTVKRFERLPNPRGDFARTGRCRERRVRVPNDLRSQAETLTNQERFLDAFKQVGNVSAAAKLAGIGRRTHYDWLAGDPEYATNFADAEETAADALEMEARRRAVLGIKEDVLYKGRVVATKKTYSDTLLIFLLNGARPEKYRARYDHRHTGSKGGPIQIQHSTIDLRLATDDELAQLDALNERIAQRAIEAAEKKDSDDSGGSPPPPLPESNS